MKFKKSQGQTLERVTIDPRSHVFSHGQLYVPLCRATKHEHVLCLITDENRSCENENSSQCAPEGTSVSSDTRPVQISTLSGLYEPLQYPSLFPTGTPGWDISLGRDDKLSQMQYYRYICASRLQIRQNRSPPTSARTSLPKPRTAPNNVWRLKYSLDPPIIWGGWTFGGRIKVIFANWVNFQSDYFFKAAYSVDGFKIQKNQQFKQDFLSEFCFDSYHFEWKWFLGNENEWW